MKADSKAAGRWAGAAGPANSSSSVAWELWAKTGAEGRWHALPYHLLDVAAAAEEL